MTAMENEATLERRRSGRIHKRIAVRAAWNQDGRELSEEMFTVCISRFGCCVASRNNVPTGTLITFYYENRAIQGSVSYVLRSSAAEHFEWGVGFESDGSAFWGMRF
jgi:hypothetical protein